MHAVRVENSTDFLRSDPRCEGYDGIKKNQGCQVRLCLGSSSSPRRLGGKAFEASGGIGDRRESKFHRSGKSNVSLKPQRT